MIATVLREKQGHRYASTSRRAACLIVLKQAQIMSACVSMHGVKCTGLENRPMAYASLSALSAAIKLATVKAKN